MGNGTLCKWIGIVFTVHFLHVSLLLMELKFTFQTQSASSTLQKHKSSSSFTPFIDPRLLQISPSSGTTVTSVGKYCGVEESNCQTQGPLPAQLPKGLRHGMVAGGTVPPLERPSALIACVPVRSWSISFPCHCLLEHLFFEKVSDAAYECYLGHTEVGGRSVCVQKICFHCSVFQWDFPVMG